MQNVRATCVMLDLKKESSFPLSTSTNIFNKKNPIYSIVVQTLTTSILGTVFSLLLLYKIYTQSGMKENYLWNTLASIFFCFCSENICLSKIKYLNEKAKSKMVYKLCNIGCKI